MVWFGKAFRSQPPGSNVFEFVLINTNICIFVYCLHIGWGTNGMLWWWAGGSTGGASALSPPAPDV